MEEWNSVEVPSCRGSSIAFRDELFEERHLLHVLPIGGNIVPETFDWNAQLLCFSDYTIFSSEKKAPRPTGGSQKARESNTPNKDETAAPHHTERRHHRFALLSFTLLCYSLLSFTIRFFYLLCFLISSNLV